MSIIGSSLPVEEHGFALHKGAFRDALSLRYGWLPSGLLVHCVCGQGFSVDHALNCPTGGYPTLRHNELRNFTTEILLEVCADVCTEPPLQSLLGETLTYATANVEDDISAAGFWEGQHQKAYFDVKVFNLNASSYRDHRFLLYTASLRRINGGSASRGFERLKCLLLHL